MISIIYHRPDATLEASKTLLLLGGGGPGTALSSRELGAMPGGRPRGPERVEATRTGCVDSVEVTSTLPMDGIGAKPICGFSWNVVQFGSHLQDAQHVSAYACVTC